MPPTDEWIKKMWYLYTMEFYSAIKKNDCPSGNIWKPVETILVITAWGEGGITGI
jgi:hypothetical protein